MLTTAGRSVLGVETRRGLWRRGRTGKVRLLSGRSRLNTKAGLQFVTYLQFWFRRSRAVRPDCWQKGGLVGVWFVRRLRAPDCNFGAKLAPEVAFSEQAVRAAGLLSWYRQLVGLLKRLRSGRTPLILDLFCCADGVTEGARRIGGASHGVDRLDQPSYCLRFFAESFSLGDALDMEKLRYLVRRLRPTLIWASPPCQGYSTASQIGTASTAAKIIPLVRGVLETLGVPFIIENVMGALPAMRDGSMIVRGQWFGLHVERAGVLQPGGGIGAATRGGSADRR